ncbi:MAG: CARDB domain-containing protein, partial [Thermoguttaceae bacterium]
AVFLTSVPSGGNSPLAAGGSYTASAQVTLPSLPAGTYYFFVSTDVYNQQPETDKTDNTAASAAVAVSGADLTVSSVTAPAGASLGQPLTVGWTVQNTGLSAADQSWSDGVYYSTQSTFDNSAVFLTSVPVGSNSPLAAGDSYTQSAQVTLPSLPVGTYYFLVYADVYNQQAETDKTDNTAASAAVAVSGADLTVSSASAPASADFGQTVTVNWTVLNIGAGPATQSWTDGIYVSADSSFDNTATLLEEVPVGGHSPLAANAGYSQSASVTLPPVTEQSTAGTYYLYIVANDRNQQAVTNESNNVSAAQPIALTVPPLPDLQVTSLALSPNTGLQSGSPVLVQWNDINTGNGAVEGAFSDLIQVENDTTGNVLFTDALYYDPNAAGASDIAAGGSLARQYAFTLPQGPDGAGQIAVTVTTNGYHNVLEYNTAGTAETNNTAVVTTSSTLPPYPDLQVTNLAVAPVAGLQSGDVLTVTWEDANTGVAAVGSEFYDHVVVQNLTTGQTAASQDLAYDPSVAGNGAIAAGAARARQLAISLPHGTPGAGQLSVTVTTDYYNQIFEYNTLGPGGSSTAKSNNTASLTVTSALEPCADLAVSGVTAPALTIGDPAQVTVGWTVTNVGTGPTTVGSWVDAVIASPDTNPADGTTLASFTQTGPLGVSDSYQQSQTFTLPPGFEGSYHLFVETDATDVVFENGSRANSVAEAPNLFAVSPTPYADLVVSSVAVPAQGASSQPLAISWTVANQGIGSTNTSQWYDQVSLASDPAGSHIVAYLGSFEHDGVLGVGGSYTHDVDVTLPDGLSGTYYLVVTTGGPYEFIYTGNNTGVSGPVAVSFTPPPDLTPTQLSGPSTANAGDKADVSWTVQNVGPGDADGAWADDLELKEVGGTRTFNLGSFTYSTPLEAGQSYTRTEQVQLPANVQGVFQYVLATNATGSLFENGATNNTLADPNTLTLSLPANPDLQVQSVTAPSQAQAGGTVSLDFTVINQGTVPATGQWTDDVYLSLDGLIDSGATLLGSYGNQSALGPGANYQTEAGNLLIPLRDSGPAYLIVETNAGNTINTYPDVNDNTFVSPLSITPLPPADLVTSAVAAPDQAIDGSTVSVQYTVSNLGLAPTDVSNWTDTIWLTVDPKRPNPSKGDVLLATLPHGGILGNDPSVLAPPQSYTVNTTVTLPAHITGQYYITAWADSLGDVFQSEQSGNTNPDDPNELNNDNFKARPITILQTPPPDLVVTSINPQPTGLGGDDYTVQWTVTNQGGSATEDSVLFDQVYVSDQATLNAPGAHQWLLGTVEHDGAVAAGGSYTAQQTFQLSPEVYGKYVIVETNTGNTVLTATALEITPPTYEGPYTTNDVTAVPAAINRLPPADLQVTSVTGQALAYSGDPLTVTWDVTNFGNAVWAGTQYWEDDVYLSRYSTLDTNRDTLLGSVTHSNATTLGAMQSYTQSGTFTLPDYIGGTAADPQTFYLFVVADPAGTTDTNLADNDQSLGVYATAAYDNRINNQASVPQPVIYKEPDLQASDLIVPATPSYSGSTIPVTWTVTNIGNRDTHGSFWIDRVYLSSSPSLDNTSYMLAESDHEGTLGPGDSYTTTLDVQLPIGIQGPYYLLVFADSNMIGPIDSPGIGIEPYFTPLEGRVAEYQGSNITAAPLSVLLANLPDLQVTAVSAQGSEPNQADHVYAGQAYTVTYTVTNTGLGDTPATQSQWEDDIYLSLDQTLDASAIYVGTVQHTGGLPAGAGYTNSLTFQAPTDLTGPWYVFVITDPPTASEPRGSVFESNENNNATATSVPLIIDQPPPADLEIATVTVPAGAQTGGPIEIQWMGRNVGAYAASGTWTDAAYLSSSAVWNVSDPLLGDVSFTGTVQPNGTYGSVLNATMPPVAPGQYHVIVRADVFDNVYETSRLDNTTASVDVIGVTVPTLQLGVPLSTTLSTGEDQLYQVSVGAGQTLRVDLTSSDPGASNEIYLRYGAVPTSAVYDAVYQDPLQANQYAVIPSTQAGTYYILVIGQSELSANTPVTLLAHVLPFEITGVEPDEGGDSSYVTTTITGAQFDPQAIVKLVRPGFAEYEPVSYQVVNSTEIVAIFDLSNAPLGQYDVEVINPSGATAFAPYAYLVEQALAPDVSLGLGGPRVLFAGDAGTYGFTVTNNTNVDIPYVEFEYGIPQIDGPGVANPHLQMTTDLAGQPQIAGVPTASLSSVVDTNGEDLAPGYVDDLADGASAALTFNVQTYPDGLPPDASKVPPSETAFTFNIAASATALTPAEFVAQQTQDAEQLRQSILHDPTASPSLQVLAADAATWDGLYLTALEQAGLLQPVDMPPAVHDNPLITSLTAMLASGILAGPAGNEIITSGNLAQFFQQVLTWYGNDPATTTPYIGQGQDLIDPNNGGTYLEALPPPASEFNQNEASPTHFEAYNVYVWYENDWNQDGIIEATHPENPNPETPQSVNFSPFFSLVGSQGQATITGPLGYGSQQFIPEGQPLPYTIQFTNPANASSAVGEVHIVEKLDPNLDPRTFQLGDLQIGDIQVQLPSGLGSFQGDFDFTQTLGYILRVSAGIDLSTDTLSYDLQAIDPATGEVISDPTNGLLPPGSNGFVTYTIKPLAGLATGTRISAQARVLFNTAPPQDTPQITQTIDGAAPTTTLTVNPVSPGSSDYQVSWNAVDDAGGSGVKGVTVYVAEDGGAYQIWLDQTTETQAIFNGQAGHTYQFLALATDNAGNHEQPPSGQSVPSDDSGVDLGSLPTVPATTSGLGAPAQPSPQPSSNPLFVQAEQGIPAPTPTANPSEFQKVLQPFAAQAFATGIGQSEAGIGPIAILSLPSGSVLVSGGPDRNELFLFAGTGGQAGAPLATLPYPIYDMALDASGNIWATTGGGPLLELNPTTGAIEAQFGESLTQSLAIDPAGGMIYVSSGNGIEVFDPVTQTFSHYSDLRVGSLAFAPDGSLWAAAWPHNANDVVRFTSAGAAPQVMLQFTSDVDSIAFGVPGSALAGLLFVSHDQAADGSTGTDLSMVDLATLQQIAVATGGTRGDEIETTADGRVLLSQSLQVDVLNPALAPHVVSSNPPPQAEVALPLGSVSVTFDEDMLADNATDPNSVLNPANYSLIGDQQGRIAIQGITYDAASRTAVLTFDSLAGDHYVLTVGTGAESAEGISLAQAYISDFQALTDYTPSIAIHFSNGRADADNQTYLYDVTLTNNTGYDLLTPLILTLDSLGPGGVQLLGSGGQQTAGSWWVDFSSLFPDARFTAGQTTAPLTVTFYNPTGARLTFHAGVLAMPTPNTPPVLDSTPVTTATAGQTYQYQVAAHDVNNAALSYLLYSGPAGMTLDAQTGLLTWAPTITSPALAPVVIEVYNARGAHTVQQFSVAVSGVNGPPVFDPLAATISGQEGQELQVTVNATDPQNYPLVYWADNLPAGAVFDPTQETLTWTPAANQVGVYANVLFVASDGVSQATESTTLLIAPAIQPPTLTRPADRTVLEGESVYIPLQASDPEGYTLTYSSSLLPGGATLDPNTGIFSWTPGYDQHGVYAIPFTVSDGTNAVTQTTTITVLNVNAPPQFDDLGAWQVAEGQDLQFRAFAFDPNNPGYLPPDRLPDGTLTPLEGSDPTITYAVSGLPPGATFDPDTAMFEWETGYTDAGNYLVTFTATNDGDGTGVPLSSSVTVPITVLNTNRPPVVAAIANQTMDHDAVLQLPVTATDPDGDPLVLTASGLPQFATFVDQGEGNGQLTFAPGAYDRGNYTITVTATDNGDGNGPYAILSDSQSFVLTVDNTDSPPRLLPIGNKVAVFGQPLQFTLRATDIYQDPLSWSAFGLPAGATLTPSSVYGQAVVAWTPAAAAAGTYTVSFQVADDMNGGAGPVLTNQQTIHVVVRATDSAPVLLPISNPTVAAGQPLTLPVQATDPDGDSLTYTAGNLPLGAALDPTTGVLSWTPNLFQAGTYNGIVLSASDGYLAATATISITVTPVNQPPILVPLPPQGGQEASPLQFTLAANDPNGATLTYSVVSGMPAGAVLNPLTGKFQWTPTYGQAGDYSVDFGVTDSVGLNDSTVVQIDIDKVDRPPTLSVTNHATTLGKTLSFALLGSSPNPGTTLTYSATGMPEGATLDPDSGQFTWTPGPTQAGDYAVSFAVSDGTLVTTQAVLLRASINPVPPQVFVELTPSYPVAPGRSVLVHASASSLAPITGLALQIDGQPVALDSQGRATFTPQSPGQVAITATATDADGMVGEYDTVLKVLDPSDQTAPVVSLDERLTLVKLTAPTNITGSVSSTNLDSWVLDTAPLGSTAFTTLASGNAPITSGVLATFDPATVENGFYQLRLTATDISGRVSRTTIIVEADTATKPTQYLRTETDLTVQLDGATFNLTRRYDSLNTGQSGSLGYGWSLAGVDTDIQTSVPPTGQEAEGVYNPFVVGTRLYLTLPDGGRAGFTFTPVEHEQTGLIYYTPAFTADSGVDYTLTSAAAVLTEAGNRFYDLKTGLPYNPASGFFTGPDYTLTGPDGTVYAIDASRGVVEETQPSGATLQITDSGIIGAEGDRLTFVHDAGGRLTTVTAPDGTEVLYDYDAAGNLVSARNVAMGQSSRYGYSASQPHLLELAVSPLAGQSVAIQYTPDPVTLPLTADLGSSGQFLLNTQDGALAPNGTDRYTFSFRSSEIESTTGGSVFLGVQIQAAPGSALSPAVPVIPGMTPLTTEVSATSAFALFDITQEGLELLELSGASATTGGAYSLQLFVAGDVNGDGTVDGTDGQLLMNALGSSAGQANYLIGADANRDGVVDAADMQLLAADLGFQASPPPVAAAGQALTHESVPIVVDLAPLATDPEGDPLYFRVIAAQDGTATLDTDGHTVTFVPAAGYSGPASFQYAADDGYSSSSPATVSVNVSSAPLVNLDFQTRLPRLDNPGDAQVLVAVGDFTDQTGAVLPASYVTWQSTDPAVMSVTANGTVTAVSDGSSVITISAQGIQAATAGTVGTPTDPLQQELYGDGLETSIQAESLAANVGYHQLDVSSGGTDLTPGSTGTVYYVSNPNVIQVDADGMVTAGNVGTATITVINGPAEAVVPVNVVTPPPAGPVTVGAAGGVVQGSDGSLVMVAPGSVTADTQMSITPLTQADLPMSLPSFAQFAGAFQLDLGSATLANPVQLVVPAPAGVAVGTEMVFYCYGSFPDADGNPQPAWIQSEVGQVESDGFVHTTSENQVTDSGLYAFAAEPTAVAVTGNVSFAAGTPEAGLTYAAYTSYEASESLGPSIAGSGSFSPADDFFLLAQLGININPDNSFTIYLPHSALSLTMSAIPARSGTPTNTSVALDLTSAGSSATINPAINTPSWASPAQVLVQSLSLNVSSAQHPVLTITGRNFGNGADPLQVLFRVGDPDGPQNSPAVGGKDIWATPDYLSPTQISVVVPNTFALGTAFISVIRTVTTRTTINGTVRTTTTRFQSNLMQFPATGIYSFSTEPGRYEVAVIDNRPQVPDPNNPGSLMANPNLNSVIADIPITASGGIPLTPLYLAVTPDHTRVYVTTKEGSIVILDALTFQQICTDNEAMQRTITLQGNPHPDQIVIDDAGNYAYVTDAVNATIYAIDVNPYSAAYDTARNIAVTGAPQGLQGLAVNADDTRLFVAAPNHRVTTFLTGTASAATSNILDINLTPDPTTGLPVWTQIATIPADQDAYGVARTSDPNVMLFTDYLSDSKSLGVIQNAETNPTVPDDCWGSLVFPDVSTYVDPDESIFAVHNASSVAVVSDGEHDYAFVTGFNAPNVELPSSNLGPNPEYPDRSPAGSCIGIFQFQGPLGSYTDPLLVAATRTIPAGFPLDLTVSPDGTYLYADFKDAPVTTAAGVAEQGAMFIYDIPNIEMAIESLQIIEKSAQPDLLQKDGIDDFVKTSSGYAYVSPDQSAAAHQAEVAIDTQAAYAFFSTTNGYQFQVYDTTHEPVALGGEAQGVAVEGYPLSVVDASGDDSPETVLADGALRVNYDFSGAAGTVTRVTLQLLQNGTVAGTLGGSNGNNYYVTPSLVDGLLNLDPTASQLTPGNYWVRAAATVTGPGGTTTIYSATQPLTVLAVRNITGTYSADGWNFSRDPGAATVFRGEGGTDVIYLNQGLGSSNSVIVSIDGQTLADFIAQRTGANAANSIVSQAIYHGTAFDYMRLADGEEIYFQGIEALVLPDGTTLWLVPQPNGLYYRSQWNLASTDVPDAWRFTTGASNVLLVSLDSGVPQAPNALEGLLPSRFSLAPNAILATFGVLQSSGNVVFAHNPNPGGSDTITRTVGNWFADGFAAHGTITIQDTGIDDGTYTIANINPAGTIITIQGNNLTNGAFAFTNPAGFGIVLAPNEHGEQAISIMAGQPNVAPGVAGINWNSPVRVENVDGCQYTLSILGNPAPGSTFTLSPYLPNGLGVTIGPIPYDITAEDLQADLQQFTAAQAGPGSAVPPINVVVTGAAGGPYTITFDQTVGMDSDGTGLNGGNLVLAQTNSLLNDIQDAMNWAQQNNQHVVFEGGIQGENWYTGNTSAQRPYAAAYTTQDLENLLSQYQNTAVFAMAAGNGGADIDNTTPPDPTTGGGVARLSSMFSNIMAVGALSHTPVPGLTFDNIQTYTSGTFFVQGSNFTQFVPPTTVGQLLPYSNYGTSLTLMGPTDSPAVNGNGQVEPVDSSVNGVPIAPFFNGTSAANPNVAGIASLVWSVDPNLTAPQVNSILEDTAMHLDRYPPAQQAPVNPYRNDQYGYGLVDAGAAVARAYALVQDPQLANLFADNGYDYANSPTNPPTAPLGPLPGGPSATSTAPPAGGPAALPSSPSVSPSSDPAVSSFPASADGGGDSSPSSSSTVAAASGSGVTVGPQTSPGAVAGGSGTAAGSGSSGSQGPGGVSPAGAGANSLTTYAPTTPINIALPAGQGTFGPALHPLDDPPAGLVDAGFDQGGDGLAGWTVSNSTLVHVNGQNEVLLQEGVTDAETDLTQDFVVPQGMNLLTFTIDATTFDSQFQNGETPDAFGVSLLDPATGQSLVPTVDGSTDSYYTQDLESGAAPALAAAGVSLSPGATPGTVQVSLDTAALDGASAELVFRVIAGSDPQSEGSVTISLGQAVPAVTASSDKTIYTGGPQAYPGSDVTVAGANGLDQSGGTLSYTYNGSATVPITAGTYAVVATFTPTDATDYATATGAATWIIGPATPVVTATDDSTAYTGGPQAYPGSDVTVTGANGLDQSGGTLSYTYNGSATVPTGVGSYAVLATFTPSDATDYNVATGTATWTIKAAITPTVTASNDSTTYNGSPQPYPGSDVTVAGANGLNQSGGTLSYTYNGSAAVPTAAGSYAVLATFTPTDATDYNVATGAATWTIKRATPAVTANSDSTTYTGGPQAYPGSDVIVSGANGLNQSGGTLSYTYNGSATVPTTAGSYA